MRHFWIFCSECIDKCKCKSARTCPYIDYYKANKDIYHPTAINSPGFIRYGKAKDNSFIKNQIKELVKQRMNAREIAEKLELDKSNVQYHIKTLVKKGKVKYTTVADKWKEFWEENDTYILKLYQQGNGYKKIANILGKSSATTIRHRLIKMGVVK